MSGGMTNAPVKDSIDNFDDDESSDIEDPDECKIILYSGVYHFGNELILRDSVPDLGPWDFVDLLESLKVEGTCDWIIFDGKNYSGEKETFTPGGSYLDSHDLGNVAWAALSVKKVE